MPLLHEKAMRGRTQTGWLDSFHTFSFGGFNDPGRMGHRALRVINEDRIIPGAGFGAHDHADMDILTYVIAGAMEHRDSLGHTLTIKAGELQCMTAGTGITHSEMNASKNNGVHFLQIWIIPDRTGLEPAYQQKHVERSTTAAAFGLLAGPVQSGAPITLNSDTWLYLADLADGDTANHAFAPGRAGFLHVMDGMIEIEGEMLSAGDGLQFETTPLCLVTARSDASVMLFDLE